MMTAAEPLVCVCVWVCVCLCVGVCVCGEPASTACRIRKRYGRGSYRACLQTVPRREGMLLRPLWLQRGSFVGLAG